VPSVGLLATGSVRLALMSESVLLSTVGGIARRAGISPATMAGWIRRHSQFQPLGYADGGGRVAAVFSEDVVRAILAFRAKSPDVSRHAARRMRREGR
jgi:hypothetical protein